MHFLLFQRIWMKRNLLHAVWHSPRVNLESDFVKMQNGTSPNKQTKKKKTPKKLCHCFSAFRLHAKKERNICDEPWIVRRKHCLYLHSGENVNCSLKVPQITPSAITLFLLFELHARNFYLHICQTSATLFACVNIWIATEYKYWRLPQAKFIYSSHNNRQIRIFIWKKNCSSSEIMCLNSGKFDFFFVNRKRRTQTHKWILRRRLSQEIVEGVCVCAKTRKNTSSPD